MIDTKLLRQKILDLAIRGKLVPQDPNDEPACELLKKIKAEKEALIKAGKLTCDKHESFIFQGDDKRYYEQIDGKTIDITDEIPFDIPETWEWCRLAPLLHYLSTGPFGSALHKRDYVQGGIPLINPMHIDMEKAIITPSDNARISPETAERLSAYKLSIGDIVIARRGEMGRAAIITEKEQGWLCGTGSFFLHFSSLFFNDYFINFIHTPYSKKQLGGTAVGTTMCNLNHKILSDLLIPIPPLTEQKRIVSQIEVLFAEVDKIDKDSADLESALSLAKQKVLDLAIRGKLVPQNPEDEPASELLKRIKAEKEALVRAGKIKRDRHESYIFRGDDNCYHENIDGKVTDITDEIPFELANGWSWCRLNNVASLADGDWIESKDQAPTGFRLIQTGNIGKCVFLPHDERARYISQETFSNLNCTEIFPGDCLISRLPDPLGRSCIIPDLQERMITAVDCTITRPYKLGLSSLYFMYFTGTTIYNEYVEKNATGSTRKRISRANLDKVLIPLPPIAEQKRIVSQVEKLFSVLETMRG